MLSRSRRAVSGVPALPRGSISDKNVSDLANFESRKKGLPRRRLFPGPAAESPLQPPVIKTLERRNSAGDLLKAVTGQRCGEADLWFLILGVYALLQRRIDWCDSTQ